ncbi:Hsp20 family protein [Rhodobaculum claviforme]|uniref:Heat-shock protein Hsp20 n=1 Tax=Rhodobaculum claviforme TaxID=1549854 RepID=A0A934TKN4_9RHOB|nr:Hsp20 family protein [Rhodobaculum claviforme]MBK5927920.1 heat-shock protein Hsp20 [Rhodobaculum claviforme]
MTKMTFGAHPFLLGFDRLDRMVERSARTGSDGFPPYNIELVAENAWRITLAVAGFGTGDLDITLEDRQLMVRGRQPEDSGARVFLHRGIAGRAFQRAFVLADGVEVAGATHADGLLHIDLRRAAPEPVVRAIDIARA